MNQHINEHHASQFANAALHAAKTETAAIVEA